MAATPGNSLNLTGAAGIVLFDGTSAVTTTAPTNHAILIGTGSNSFGTVASGTTGQVLQAVTSANPSYSTATYPSTTTINQLLYSSSANTVGGLATANSAILNTSSGGVPSLATSPSCSGTLTAGTGLTATTGAITATAGNFVCTAGNLTLPNTNSGGSAGTIQVNSLPFMSNFGTSSTFLGSAAGNSSNTGSFNTGIGFNALTAISSGQDNTCVGRLAGSAITTQSGNTCVGNAAGNTTTGSNGTFIGENTGNSFNVISGTENLGVGYSTLRNLTTGARNICIGSNTGNGYTSSESNNICIQNGGTTGESNVLRIGQQGSGSYQQNACYIAGIVGVTPSNLQPVAINSSTGQLGVAVTVASNTGTSAAPAATSSTAAYVMMGLGSSWKLTPTTFGNIRIAINGQMTNNTTGDGTNIIMAYGTGAAPVNGAAVTGTTVGINTIFTDLSGLLTNGVPFAKNYIITGLTAGTAYWFDLQFKAVTGGSASCLNLEFTAQELVS